MAKIIADRVVEASTTVGTGAYTLIGALVGFRSASSVCVNGDTFEYFAEQIDGSGLLTGDWETGLGTWGTGGVLTRATIYASSNAGAAVSWSAGSKRIALGVTAEYLKSLPIADAAVLTAAKAYADSLVVGLWDDRQNFDASVNTYPTAGGSGTAGAILKGDIWTISVAATAGPLLGFSVGSTVRAGVDTPAQIPGNWALLNVGLGYVPENTANKDASGGYPSLIGQAIKVWNASKTFYSTISYSGTANYAQVLPNKAGTVAMTSDITGGALAGSFASLSLTGAAARAKFDLQGGASSATNLATVFSTSPFYLQPKATSGWGLSIFSGPSDTVGLQANAVGTAAGPLSINKFGGDVEIGSAGAAVTIRSSGLTVNDDSGSNHKLILGSPGLGVGACTVEREGGGALNSDLVFKTTYGGSPITRFRIDGQGNVLVTSSALLGYGINAGGTVVQPASKSTATASLSKPCGQIEMHPEALGPGVSVLFQFVNPLITDFSCVHAQPFNNNNYRVETFAVLGGSAYIKVTNIAAVTLYDALKLNFQILRGSTT